jgi:hypothetical protein
MLYEIHICALKLTSCIFDSHVFEKSLGYSYNETGIHQDWMLCCVLRLDSRCSNHKHAYALIVEPLQLAFANKTMRELASTDDPIFSYYRASALHITT